MKPNRDIPLKGFYRKNNEVVKYKENPKNNLLQTTLNAEKIDLLYKKLLISIPASLLCATIVFIAFYRIPHSSLLIYWYLAMFFLSGIRLSLTRYYSFAPGHKEHGFYPFIITTCFSAILWGVAGSVLMPEHYLIEQMIAIIVLAGVTAGGVQSLQESFLACFIYSTFTIAPLCTWIFLQKTIPYNILGFSTTVYLLFLFSISWRSNQFLNETLQLKYENIQQNKQLTKMNQALIEKENNLRLIHDNAPIGMAIVALDGKWLNVNNKLCEIVGFNKHELENLTMQDLTYQEDVDIDEDKKAKLLRGELSSYQIEKRYLHKNGQLIWILTNVSLVRNKENKPLYFISQIQNINDRKQNEKIIAELSSMNETLQLCNDSTETYSIISNTARQLFFDLSGGLAIFNKDTNELETVTTWGDKPLLKSFFYYTTCWGFRAGNVYTVNDPSKEHICQHFDSTPPGGYVCMPLIVQNQTLGILSFNTSTPCMINSYQKHIINNFGEIVKLSLANIVLKEALRDQAIHDALTGLVNRHYLYEWLPKVLQHTIHTKNVLCLSMLDIDYFKHINDKYGHEAGDEVLAHIAKILKSNVRESDIACRFGGEEFVIVLIGTDIDHAKSQMEHIRNEIKNAKMYVQNQSLPQITVSIGIADAPRFGSTMAELLRIADASLYTAKASGRDRVVLAGSTAKLKIEEGEKV